jgi:hypothetical protein
LIDYIRFYVPLKNFSLIWICHYCQWKAAKFRLMFGAQGLWAGRDLYRVTPAVTRDLCFPGLIQRTAPFSRFLRPTTGCGESILTWILTGRDIWSRHNCESYDCWLIGRHRCIWKYCWRTRLVFSYCVRWW